MVGGVQLRAQQVQSRDAGDAPGGLGVQAVRLHDRDRSRLHADRRCCRTRPSPTTRGPGQPPYSPQNYEKDFWGPINGPPRARALAQRADDPADGRARPEAGHRLRAPVRPDRAAAAVPADRARRRRRDADRNDQRLLRLPEPGRADDAVLGAEGHRPRRQPARGESSGAAGRDPRRHRLRDDEPAARRRRARHRRSRRRR